MKNLSLSPTTIEILGNLASINHTLFFDKGSSLVTRSVKKHTYAEVLVSEKFPKRFNIYDLNQFLAVVKQFSKPVLNFSDDENSVKVSDETGGLTVTYMYGNESLCYIPDPKKKISLPSVDVEFRFTEADFKSLSSMGTTLGTPELALQSDGKVLRLVTIDSKNASTNTTDLIIGDAPTKDQFSFVWLFEYLKLYKGTYDVSVSKQGISKFQHKDLDLSYHILLQANPSTYENAPLQ